MSCTFHIHSVCSPADKCPHTSLCRIRKRGNNMESTTSLTAGLSANFHLIEACNAHCKYCFATFPHLQKKDRLSTASRKKLVDGGFGKINFAGGEPTLVRDLGALCERIKKRGRGRCAVSIVSNGKRLQRLIDESAKWIDWAALSLDSGSDDVNATLGRTGRGVPYVSKILEYLARGAVYDWHARKASAVLVRPPVFRTGAGRLELGIRQGDDSCKTALRRRA